MSDREGRNNPRQNEVSPRLPMVCRKNPVSGPIYQRPEPQSEESEEDDDLEEVECVPRLATARKNALPRSLIPELRPRIVRSFCLCTLLSAKS